MSIPITNMKELLMALKEVLKSYNSPGGILEGFAIKRGILPPLPLFPTIALLPVDEIYFMRGSGGRYNVRRGVAAEVYIKGLDIRDMEYRTMKYLDDLKRIFWTEYKVDGKSYDIEHGDMSLGEPIPWKDRFVQRGVLPISVKSREFMAEDAAPGPNLYEEEAKDLLDRIYDKIYFSPDLDKVKLKKKGVVEPTTEFPMISVNENVEASRRAEEVGIERNQRDFETNTFTKLLAKERSLDFSLDITEIIKRLFQKYKRWDGYCWNSWIDRINYGMYTSERVTMYNSQIALICLSKEKRG